MTIGEFIEIIKMVPPSTRITDSENKGFGDLRSDRGSYEDLGIDEGNIKTTGELIILLMDEGVNETFTGYKGGEFTMELDSILKIHSYYSCSGSEIILIEFTKEGLKVITEDDITSRISVRYY